MEKVHQSGTFWRDHKIVKFVIHFAEGHSSVGKAVFETPGMLRELILCEIVKLMRTFRLAYFY